MNRNVESHFALNPTSLDIGRSQFDRSSGVKFSANVGELIPFYVDEILPGDTFKINTSKVVRLQTLVHPIMDNMYLDTYWFFVPNRLVWTSWKNFCGEADDAWVPAHEWRIPKINITSDTYPHPGQGSLMDYMGIPLGVVTNTNSGANPKGGINALPFRAYAKVCDDWFRSEAVTDPLVIPTGDSDVNVNAKTDPDIYCAYGGPVFHACKYHDYFTSCLPAPQSGPAVKIPVSADARGLLVRPGNIVAYGVDDSSPAMALQRRLLQSAELKWNPNSKTMDKTGVVGYDPSDEVPAFYEHALGSLTGSVGYAPNNLWAGADPSFFGTINDLRLAFQVQKFYEKMARGRRYIEVLKAQFNVTSPDARLQRSEYLGGNRIPLNISEVTNNSKSDSAFLGDLGGMSRTTDVHSDFVKSFTEHGYLLGLCVVRYDHTYPQGVDRMYSRTSMFDFYWPVFANIGEQAVWRSSINFDHYMNTLTDDVFGYQEAWADYRYKPSRVMGEMRPEASGSLASWHLADFYDQTGDPDEPTHDLGPHLSDSWIREDKSNVDRCLAVTSATANQYFADFWVQNICTRVMPMYSIPGLADHH